MKIKNLNTQYTLITIEKECSHCNGYGLVFSEGATGPITCPTCGGKIKKINNHIVSNNGWFPLSYYIEKFKDVENEKT